MICPNCGLEQSDVSECSRCGAIVQSAELAEKVGASPLPRVDASESGSQSDKLPSFSAASRAVMGTIIIFAGIITPLLIVAALLFAGNFLVRNFGQGESGLAWLTVIMFATVPVLVIGSPSIGIILAVVSIIKLKKYPRISFARPYLFFIIFFWSITVFAVPAAYKIHERKEMVKPDLTEAEAKENLYKAIRRSDYEVINELLDRFPQLLNSPITERFHESPLLVAFSNWNVKTAQFLLDRGADVNFKEDSGETVLHYAAERGQTEWVKIFIAKGADVNAPGKQRYTPLHLASVGHNEDACNAIAETLLGAGARVDTIKYDGNTPLHEAVKRRRLDMAVMLLEHGADVNAKNDKGQTPLAIARETAAFHQAEKDTMWGPCGKYEKTLKTKNPQTEQEKTEWRKANDKCDQEMIDLLSRP